MISNCANANCGAPFHYLRGGRLYRFDLRRPTEPCADVPNAICATKPTHASVFFWLCADCSRKYTVQFSSRQGAAVLPLSQGARRLSPVVARFSDAD